MFKPDIKTASRLALLSVLFVASQGMTGRAFAATQAMATANVNLRAGPSTGYPVVTTLPAGASITTHGCLQNNSWCDIGWGASRGWVSASYIQVIHAGKTVVLSPTIIPVVGITVVAFNQTYWNTHYAGRPWHGRYHAYPPYHHPHKPHHPGPYPVDRSVSRECDNGSCTRNSVATGPRGGQVTRDRTITRPNSRN